MFLAALALALASFGVHLFIGYLSSSAALGGASHATGGVYMLGSATSGARFPSAITSTLYGHVSEVPGVFNSAAPSWTPTAGSSGSVVRGGDLALVDTSSASSTLHVTLHVVNLPALAQDYSTFAFPVAVFYAATGAPGTAPIAGSCDAATGCNWRLATGVRDAPKVSNAVTYLTNDGGSVAFRFPAGALYEIAMPAGGSYYCTSTATSAHASLSPTFFVNASAA